MSETETKFTPELIAQLRALSVKATARPYVVNSDDYDVTIVSLAAKDKYGHDQYICQTVYDQQSDCYRAWSETAHEDDAAFIAAAANAFDTMLDEIERLQNKQGKK